MSGIVGEALRYWGQTVRPACGLPPEDIGMHTPTGHRVAAAVREDLARGDGERLLDAMRWFGESPDAAWNREEQHPISTVLKFREKYASKWRAPKKKRANASERGYHPDVVAPTMTDEEYARKAAALWDPLK